ncbi:MAG: AFG1/ZapE family ATPase, partial [Betaproteobacteria bacterium]
MFAAGQPAQGDSPAVVDQIRQIAQDHGFPLDAAQLGALEHFARLQDELIDSEQAGRSLLRVFLRQQPVKGIYLWGGVGRGKSFLMDAFCDAVPIDRKLRVHFHRF